MDFNFDEVINECDKKINILKSQKLNDIKKKVLDFKRDINNNQYTSAEDLINVKNQIIKLKEEYFNIVNQMNNDNNKTKINISKDKKDNFKKFNNFKKDNKFNNNNNNNDKNKNDDNIEVIKINSFADFLEKLLNDEYKNYQD